MLFSSLLLLSSHFLYLLSYSPRLESPQFHSLYFTHLHYFTFLFFILLLFISLPLFCINLFQFISYFTSLGSSYPATQFYSTPPITFILCTVPYVIWWLLKCPFYSVYTLTELFSSFLLCSALLYSAVLYSTMLYCAAFLWVVNYHYIELTDDTTAKDEKEDLSKIAMKLVAIEITTNSSWTFFYLVM